MDAGILSIKPDEVKQFVAVILAGVGGAVAWWTGRKTKKAIARTVGTPNGRGNVIEMNEEQLVNQAKQLAALAKANDAMLTWQSQTVDRFTTIDKRQERVEEKVDHLVEGMSALTSEIRSQRHVALDVSKFEQPTTRTTNDD